MSKARTGLWRVYRVPVLLAAASAVGLVAALLGDGAMDALSWLTLGVMALLTVWALRR
ncbi:hypothetical protein [Sphingomonas gilva]|uniref:hypothetical protein n=1 Tax=Sphingomonas gilva TaxID=2305907 RepID=UPI0015FA1F59|nr:hypothetical protein [Sphingomonas gilva]